MITNKLKKVVSSGGTVIGTFIVSASPDLVEIAAISGFNFVVIDNEHGFICPESLQHLVRAAELRGIAPIVRIPNARESTILHTLDIGAHGIQVPQVNNAQTALEIVRYSKFAPAGRRGVAFPRAADYAMAEMTQYFRDVNDQTMIITHCENEECLLSLDEICAITEVDVVFIGPYDMSQSMGVIGQVTHPKVEDAVKKVLEVTKKHGKAAGIFAGSGAIAKERAKQGFQYIAIGMDTVLFGQKCKQEVSAYRD